MVNKFNYLNEYLHKYSHIVWDWNGTLLNDIGCCYQAVTKVLELYRKNSITLSQYLDTFRFPVIEYYRDLGFDLDKEDYNQISRIWYSIYESMLDNCNLFEGHANLIKQLVAEGISCSILTAARTEDVENLLWKHGIKEAFSFIVGAKDYSGQGKIALGRGLLRKINLPSNKVVLIGDTDHDGEVAYDLGIDGILLTGGHQSKRRLNNFLDQHSNKGPSKFYLVDRMAS